MHAREARLLQVRQDVLAVAAVERRKPPVEAAGERTAVAGDGVERLLGAPRLKLPDAWLRAASAGDVVKSELDRPPHPEARPRHRVRAERERIARRIAGLAPPAACPRPVVALFRAYRLKRLDVPLVADLPKREYRALPQENVFAALAARDGEKPLAGLGRLDVAERERGKLLHMPVAVVERLHERRRRAPVADLPKRLHGAAPVPYALRRRHRGERVDRALRLHPAKRNHRLRPHAVVRVSEKPEKRLERLFAVWRDAPDLDCGGDALPCRLGRGLLDERGHALHVLCKLLLERGVLRGPHRRREAVSVRRNCRDGVRVNHGGELRRHLRRAPFALGDLEGVERRDVHASQGLLGRLLHIRRLVAHLLDLGVEALSLCAALLGVLPREEAGEVVELVGDCLGDGRDAVARDGDDAARPVGAALVEREVPHALAADELAFRRLGRLRRLGGRRLLSASQIREHCEEHPVVVGAHGVAGRIREVAAVDYHPAAAAVAERAHRVAGVLGEDGALGAQLERQVVAASRGNGLAAECLGDVAIARKRTFFCSAEHEDFNRS